MLLMIDTLGKRYGILPSEVLGKATTFDLYIMDAAMSFENYHHKKAENNGVVPIDLNEDEMLEILKKARE